MASFVPTLADPGNPEAVAEWALQVANLINGQLSIGEPVSEDTTRLPNGVKGHLIGSFVEVTLTAQGQQISCVHNLNVPMKGQSAPVVYTDPLNVGWVIVRAKYAAGAAAVGGGLYADWHATFPVTANAITLEFHSSAHVPSVPFPVIVTVWFFPTTR